MTSRVHVGERHAALLETHHSAGVPVAIPAPTIQELVRGLGGPTVDRERAQPKLRWFRGLLFHPLTIVIPFDRWAAELAGRLLAKHPHPPTGDHRRQGTRAQQRAAWMLDAQIAACAFAGGYGVLTENVDDFGTLRDALAELLPHVPALVVSDGRI